MPKIDIIPYPFEEQCDVSGCFSRKKYAITAHGGPPGLYFGLCEGCLEGFIDAIIETPHLNEILQRRLEPVEVGDIDEENTIELNSAEPTLEKIEEGKVVCSICGKEFDNSSQLRGHMLSCKRRRKADI